MESMSTRYWKEAIQEDRERDRQQSGQEDFASASSEECSWAFAAEDRQEQLEESPGQVDAIYGPEDLPSVAVGQGAELEKDLQLQEDMEDIRREGDPENEKVRRQQWLRLKREERIGIRRLHVMTSHATKPQLQRMLRHANAPAEVVKGVKYFRCSACESKMEEARPPITKVPNPYTFNHIVGLDAFELKDCSEARYHVLHCVCHGSTFQVAEVLGEAKGVPPSHLCLQAFLRMWVNWAGVPDRITVDRGTHNKGIFPVRDGEAWCTVCAHSGRSAAPAGAYRTSRRNFEENGIAGDHSISGRRSTGDTDGCDAGG